VVIIRRQFIVVNDGVNNAGLYVCFFGLTTETVQSASLSLKSIDNIQSGDSLASGVFSVGDGVLDNRLQEGLKNASGLLVDEGRDSLDTTSSCQSANGWLGDTLDVIS
jgi:hypothetical protein